jgi:hypothetical protein
MMCETCGQPSNTVVCDSCNTTSKGMTNPSESITRRADSLLHRAMVLMCADTDTWFIRPQDQGDADAWYAEVEAWRLDAQTRVYAFETTPGVRRQAELTVRQTHALAAMRAALRECNDAGLVFDGAPAAGLVARRAHTTSLTMPILVTIGG